jgi:hypothetical protein
MTSSARVNSGIYEGASLERGASTDLSIIIALSPNALPDV